MEGVENTLLQITCNFARKRTQKELMDNRLRGRVGMICESLSMGENRYTVYGRRNICHYNFNSQILNSNFC